MGVGQHVAGSADELFGGHTRPFPGPDVVRGEALIGADHVELSGELGGRGGDVFNTRGIAVLRRLLGSGCCLMGQPVATANRRLRRASCGITLPET